MATISDINSDLDFDRTPTTENNDSYRYTKQKHSITTIWFLCNHDTAQLLPDC